MRTSHDDTLALRQPGIAGDWVAQAARLPAGLVRRARRRLRLWALRLEERAFLASLDDFELSRLGLTPDRRNDEVGKALWER